MQIRERGGKVELLRSVYSKEDKRCTMKLIGSADKYSRTFPAVLLEKLSDDERAEASTWLKTRIEAESVANQKYAVRGAAGRLKDLAIAIPVVGLDAAQAAAIQEAWKLVQKAIRKAVKPAPKPKTAAEQLKTQDQPSCKCGKLMVDKTVTKAGENKGRRYWMCPDKNDANKAQHNFKWIEE